MDVNKETLNKVISAYKTICSGYWGRVAELFEKPSICCEERAFRIKLLGFHLENVDVGHPPFNFSLDEIAANSFIPIEEADNHIPQYCLVVVDHVSDTNQIHIAMVGMHRPEIGSDISNMMSHIYVREEYRHKAIGFQLMLAAELFLGMISNCPTISLMAYNRDVVGFFKRCGYKELPVVSDNGSIMMRKLIPIGEYNKRVGALTVKLVESKRAKASWVLATDEKLTDRERIYFKKKVSKEIMAMYDHFRLPYKNSKIPNVPSSLLPDTPDYPSEQVILQRKKLVVNDDSKQCGNETCTNINSRYKCSRCQYIFYCCKECQVQDYPNHKLVCAMLKGPS